MQFLSNTLAFVFAIGVIIFVHELGHLLMAKRFGVRVLTFSLGFGRRLWGFRRGETDYQVSLVPLGGYVRLSGEDPGEASEDPREFLNKPRWQRILVYLAGPWMNIILAVLLVAVVFMVGVEVAALQDVPAVVGAVGESSPAAQAGIQPGDVIVEIDGKPVEYWNDVQFAVMTAPERTLPLVVTRSGEPFHLSLTPTKVPKYEFGYAGLFPKLLPRITQVTEDGPAAVAGFEVGDQIRSVDERAIAGGADFVKYIEAHAGQAVVVEVVRGDGVAQLTVTPRDEGGVGRIQVGLGYFQRYGPVEAVVASARHNWDIARQTFSVFGKIFSGQLAAKSALAGPIEIAAMSGAAARRSFVDLLYLMGLISISIALLNLMPVPVLDGGQIFVLLIESLLRKDLSLKIKEGFNMAGFVLIIALMVAVLYFDLVKNIPTNLLPGS